MTQTERRIKAPRHVLIVIRSIAKIAPVTVTLDIAANAARYRFSSVVMSADAPDGTIADFERLQIPVRQLNLSGLAVVDGVRALRRELTLAKADIVHCHGFRPDVITALARLRVPTVSTVHSDLPVDYALSFSRYRAVPMSIAHFLALRQFTSVVAVSDTVRRRAVSYGVRAVTIENGIDVDAYRPPSDRQEIDQLRRELDLPLDKIIVLHAGSLILRKRVLEVIRAFLRSRLSERAALVLAGDGPMRGECERAADGAPNVLFLGLRTDVSKLMRAADVLISASASEGFSLTLTEACASGLLILASDIPSHRETLVAFPDQAALFAYRDVEDIVRALDTRARRRNKPYSCQPASSLERISSRRMSRQYQNLYDEVCGER